MLQDTVEFEIISLDKIKISSSDRSGWKHNCVAEILLDLVSNAPTYFLGRQGAICFADVPPNASWPRDYELAFCTTQSLHQSPICLPFPCPFTLRSHGAGRLNAEDLITELLDDSTGYVDEKILWPNPAKNHQLKALQEIYAKYQDFILVKCESDAGSVIDQPHSQVEDWLRHKYLIDSPASGYSPQLKWLLATGRPVFIVERDAVEHWHTHLIPWVHYIPVKTNYSDLLKNKQIVDNDPNLYLSISQASKQFAANFTTAQSQLLNVLEIIDRRERREGFPITSRRMTYSVDYFSELSYSLIFDFLENFLSSDNDYLWLLSDKVFYDYDINKILSELSESDADFLATEIVSLPDNSARLREGFHQELGEIDLSVQHCALLAMFRVSRASATAILKYRATNISYNIETFIPTLLNSLNLSIEEIGGCGIFSPPERRWRYYDSRTWHRDTCKGFVSGQLHYPVHFRSSPPPSLRWRSHPCPKMRILYVSPVGPYSEGFLSNTLTKFIDAGAQCILFKYGEIDIPHHSSIQIIQDKGTKWQLAYKHLIPRDLREFDYIFFWDDDLDIGDFDPNTFAEIMYRNYLEMAQPAIMSPYGLSHKITQRRPLPPPVRILHESGYIPIVGRLTNFAEIMAPVWTAKAWQEVCQYADNDNSSGWGLDYIPHGLKGVVDATPVIHTRPVQSFSSEACGELEKFLRSNGLLHYKHVNMGWLYGSHREMGQIQPDHRPHRPL